MKDILKNGSDGSDHQALKEEDIEGNAGKAGRKYLFDELDQLFSWNQQQCNLTPTQFVEKLSPTVASISVKHLEGFCENSARKLCEGKPEMNDTFLEQQESSFVKVIREMVACLPELMKASRCQLGNDEMLIEALMTPIAATLVAEKENGPGKLLGFKIWQLINLNSPTAVKNHGTYFGSLMIQYGEWFHNIQYRTEASCLEIGSTGQGDVHIKILRQIVLCLQAMAAREDESNPHMPPVKTWRRRRGED